MPLTCKFIENQRIYNIKAEGLLKSSEITECCKMVTHETRNYKFRFIEIFDLNNVAEFRFKYSDLEQIIEYSNELTTTDHGGALVCAYTEQGRAIAQAMMPIFRGAKINFLLCSNEHELEENMRLLLE